MRFAGRVEGLGLQLKVEGLGLQECISFVSFISIQMQLTCSGQIVADASTATCLNWGFTSPSVEPGTLEPRWGPHDNHPFDVEHVRPPACPLLRSLYSLSSPYAPRGKP